jgi:hypothetical protein
MLFYNIDVICLHVRNGNVCTQNKIFTPCKIDEQARTCLNICEAQNTMETKQGNTINHP